jgi:catechol 2,3-dioxygenase-like lactoylglutathione lyase family enzyme
MIDHLTMYATNFDVTKKFYMAIFAELDYSLQADVVFDADPDFPGRRACAFGPAGRPVFWIAEVLEAYTPRHVAFTAQDRERVAAFHAVGLLAGGEDFGAPGPRPIYHENYFGAFLTDPDGNNVEAVCHAPPA